MLGIYLGREHSQIAAYTDKGPVVLSDLSGASLIPAAVAVNSAGSVLAGNDARKYLVQFPEAGQVGFLRNLGAEESYAFGGQQWSPAACASELLKHLAQLAEREMGGPPGPAVIAVPAYFHDGQRQAVADAARQAGLNLRGLLNEPSAAALAYYFEKQKACPTLMVLSFSPGGFDVTILKLHETGFTILGCDGLDAPAASAFDAPAGRIETVAPPIRRALKNAKLDARSLDDILALGDLPRLSDLNACLEREFGRQAQTHSHPEQAVALGAAIYCKVAPRVPAVVQAPPNQAAGRGKPGCLVFVLAGIGLAWLRS